MYIYPGNTSTMRGRKHSHKFLHWSSTTSASCVCITSFTMHQSLPHRHQSRPHRKPSCAPLPLTAEWLSGTSRTHWTSGAHSSQCASHPRMALMKVGGACLWLLLLYQTVSLELTNLESTLFHCMQWVSILTLIYCEWIISIPAGNNRSHLIASVGDDNALTVSEIAVDLSVSTGSTVASLIRQCSEVSAHSSSITGKVTILCCLANQVITDLNS